MTTRTSSSAERSSNHRFFNGKFFKFQLKTGWPLFVVFIVLFTLSMIIPTVKCISDRIDYVPEAGELITWASQFLYCIGIVNVVISMLAGLLCGITAMKYTNNKVSVNFYHSLPLRREALFTTSTLHGFIYYAVSFTVGLAVMLTVFAVKVGHFSMLIRPVLLTLEYGILFFFLVYAMTLFAASLTGTGFMRFVGAAYVIFLPLAVYCIVVTMLWLDRGGSNLIDLEYYMSGSFLIPLSCPLRFIELITYDAEGNIGFVGAFGKEIAIVIVTAIVFYGLAFLLYCFRRSESASQPVIWNPARFIFKYATIFIGGTLFGLVFEMIFESEMGMFLGVFFGSLVTFMLTNGILHKSARAIFKGLRGFGVYACVMAVVSIVLCADVLGMFTSIPNPSYVKSVEITYDYTYTAEYGGDFARKATKLLAAAEKYDPDSTDTMPINTVVYEDGNVYAKYGGEDKLATVPDELYGVSRYNTLEYKTVQAVFRTKLGIPYAVRFNKDCEEMYELAEFLRDTGKFEPDISESTKLWEANMEFSLIGESEDEEELIIRIPSSDVADVVSELSDPLGTRSTSPRIGALSVYSRNGNSWYTNTEYTVTAEDYEIINELADIDKKFESEDDVLEYLIGRMGTKHIYVQKVGTDKYERIDDSSDIFDVVSTLENLDEYHYADSPLCRRAHTYNVYVIGEGDTVYGAFDFIKGCVPEFVEELFEDSGAPKD